MANTGVTATETVTTAGADERRSRRLDVRVTPSEEAMIRQAAAHRRQSVTEFLIESALGAAERTVDDERRVVLMNEVFDRLVDEMEEPGQVIPALAQLIKRPRRLKLPDQSTFRVERSVTLADVPDDEQLLEIRLLEPADNVDDFVSGEETIDEYLARFALPMQNAGGPRTHVAVVGHRVVGYYSLVSGSIEREVAPERLKAGMGAYPIPTQVLARMGVHQDHQGHGLGGDLLLAAMVTVARAAELVGVRAIVTHPLNHGLTGFYGRFGFGAFADPPNEWSMFVLMKDVRKTLRDAGLL